MLIAFEPMVVGGGCAANSSLCFARDEHVLQLDTCHGPFALERAAQVGQGLGARMARDTCVLAAGCDLREERFVKRLAEVCAYEYHAFMF